MPSLNIAQAQSLWCGWRWDDSETTTKSWDLESFDRGKYSWNLDLRAQLWCFFLGFLGGWQWLENSEGTVFLSASFYCKEGWLLAVFPTFSAKKLQETCGCGVGGILGALEPFSKSGWTKTRWKHNGGKCISLVWLVELWICWKEISSIFSIISLFFFHFASGFLIGWAIGKEISFFLLVKATWSFFHRRPTKQMHRSWYSSLGCWPLQNGPVQMLDDYSIPNC